MIKIYTRMQSCEFDEMLLRFCHDVATAAVSSPALRRDPVDYLLFCHRLSFIPLFVLKLKRVHGAASQTQPYARNGRVTFIPGNGESPTSRMICR